MPLRNPLLHRYWIQTRLGKGFGVTAYSVEDAKFLLVREWGDWYEHLNGRLLITDISEIIEDIDIQQLDQNHIVPNIGPIIFRGIWFPKTGLH